jgi:putative peptidoglycan lipid II flippase
MMSFLNRKSQTITSAALVLGVASLTARLLGVVRDRVLAGTFGASRELDIYYASFKIPDLLYDLVILGALSAAFIPLLSEARTKNLEQKFASNIINIGGLALIFISGLIFVFAAPLMNLIAAGFSSEERFVASEMTRILSLSPILLGLSSMYASILQVHGRFLAFSLSPIVYNGGIILGALFLVPVFGIYGVALGVVGGALAHFLVPFIASLSLGFRWKLVFNFYDPFLRRLLIIGIPRFFASAASQINLVIVTAIATTLPSGSLSVFNFANNLQSFPLGVIGISLATAAFPTFTSLAVNNQKNEFLAKVVATLRQIIFFLTPAATLLLVLRAQIVRVVLGTGRFDWEDTRLTYGALSVFALSLVAQALVPLLNRAFYALKNSWVPFASFCLAVLVNIVLSFTLAPTLGVIGLAWAFSCASFLNFTILAIVFEIKGGTLLGRKELLFFVSVMLASILMVLTVQGMKYVMAPFVDMHTGIGVFLHGLTAGISGIVVYLGFAYWFKVKEVKLITQLFQGLTKGGDGQYGV